MRSCFSDPFAKIVMQQLNEDQFWSSALGTWIKDCICSTSEIAPSRTWRHRTRNELQPTDDEQPVQYSELCDGYALNLIFLFIDPEASDQIDGLIRERTSLPTITCSHTKNPSTSSEGSPDNALPNTPTSLSPTSITAPLPGRLKAFRVLLHNLRTFYRSRSQLLMSLPDAVTIVRHPVPG
ncbi:hypothetical protein Ddc_08390 [Ditylenchus destructor]|nr:hypothetical protein Ddc_08390 [Ditylenchus destructor]